MTRYDYYYYHDYEYLYSTIYRVLLFKGTEHELC